MEWYGVFFTLLFILSRCLAFGFIFLCSHRAHQLCMWPIQNVFLTQVFIQRFFCCKLGVFKIGCKVSAVSPFSSRTTPFKVSICTMHAQWKITVKLKLICSFYHDPVAHSYAYYRHFVWLVKVALFLWGKKEKKPYSLKHTASVFVAVALSVSRVLLMRRSKTK